MVRWFKHLLPQLRPCCGDIYFQGEDAEGTNTNLLQMLNSGSRTYVKLFENSSERLRTLSGGVGVTGLTVGDVDANPHNAGGLQVVSTLDEKIVLSGSNSPYIRFQEGTTDKAYIQWTSSGYLQFVNQETGLYRIYGTNTSADLILTRGDTATTSGEDLGSINFGHTDGSHDFPTQSVGQHPVRIVAEATEATGDGDDGGRLRFFTKATDANKATDSLERMRIEESGYVELYSRLDMNNNDIYGVDQIFHQGDTNTYMQFHAADQWRVVTGGSERLEVNNTNTTVANNLIVSGNTTFNGTVTGISAGAEDDIFWENNQAVTSNYTITNNKNAMSAGPITINSGITVTVGDGEAWTVV